MTDEERMAQLYETVEYVGTPEELRPWQDEPDLATSDDEPDDPNPVPSKKANLRGDLPGHPFRGNQYTETAGGRAIVATFAKGLKPAESYPDTRFILPDGTRLASRENNHYVAAENLGTTLKAALQAGIVRFKPGHGAEVGAPITDAQAQHLLDAAHYGSPTAADYGPRELYVDVYSRGRARSEADQIEYSRIEDADTLRKKVNAHFASSHDLIDWSAPHRIILLGDVEGHPFRGNQWTGGTGTIDEAALKKQVARYTHGGYRETGRVIESSRNLITGKVREISEKEMAGWRYAVKHQDHLNDEQIDALIEEGKVKQRAADEAVRVVVDAVRQATPVETPLYRAVYVSKDGHGPAKFNGLKAGDDFSLDQLSSFSGERGEAAHFAMTPRSIEFGVTDPDRSMHPSDAKDYVNYEFKIEGSHKSLDVSTTSKFREHERLTYGQFKVVKVEDHTTATTSGLLPSTVPYRRTITIRQVEVPAPARTPTGLSARAETALDLTDWFPPHLFDLGDVEGHPFRGNQWTGGMGGRGTDPPASEVVTALESGQPLTLFRSTAGHETHAPKPGDPYTLQGAVSARYLQNPEQSDKPNQLVHEVVLDPKGLTVKDMGSWDADAANAPGDLEVERAQLAKEGVDVIVYNDAVEYIPSGGTARNMRKEDHTTVRIISDRAAQQVKVIESKSPDAYRPPPLRPRKEWDPVGDAQLDEITKEADRVGREQLARMAAAAEKAPKYTPEENERFHAARVAQILAKEKKAREAKVHLGDAPGHPFRGNQYADGASDHGDRMSPMTDAAAQAVGGALDKLMAHFGADWLAVLARLHKVGALPELLKGNIDVPALKQLPEIRRLIKGDADRAAATNLPDISDVSFPKMIGAIDPVKPKRKRRKPVLYQGVKLSRRPTHFEAAVMSLTEIPPRLDAAVAGLVNGSATLAATVQDMADFGAREVCRELVRQGADAVILNAVPSVDTTECVARLVHDRDDEQAATLAAIERRLARTKLTGERRGRVVEHLLAKRWPGALKWHAARSVNEAFALGRRAAIAAFRRRTPMSLAYHDDQGKFISEIEAVNQGIIEVDAVIMTAIMDTATCDECSAVDGETMELSDDRVEELRPPYVKCEGGDRCRCALICLLSNGNEINIDEIDDETIQEAKDIADDNA